MKAQRKRIFNLTDDVLVETSSTMHQLFVENISDFSEFDPFLNNSFAEQWFLKIEKVIQWVKDHQILNEQKQKTIEVKIIVEQAVEKYNEVRYFVKKAFKNNKTQVSEFGSNINSAKQSMSKLLVFMDILHKACLKHETLLIDNGYSSAQIEEINNIKNNLLNTNTNQEHFKKHRAVNTEERIEALNNLYLDTIRVANSAKIIYAKDFARKKMFVVNKS